MQAGSVELVAEDLQPQTPPASSPVTTEAPVLRGLRGAMPVTQSRAARS